MSTYSVTANSTAGKAAEFNSHSQSYPFSLVPDTADQLPGPADLMLGSLAACILKNVERFSHMLKFQYTSATVEVIGERIEKPASIIAIRYALKIASNDPNLNISLLQKNISKFGTIYNTLAKSCEISGNIEVIL